MIKMNLQLFGGRGASGDIPLADGPMGGGNDKTKWGQPNTPVVVPAPTIAQQIGEKGRPISAAQALKNVNPYRDAEYGDYSENCQRCVVAYELNRRGYNVEASEAYGDKDPYPYAAHWKTAFEGAKLESVGSKTTDGVNKRIKKLMSGWGDGSRGIIRVRYGGHTGHVFNVEYHKGSLYFYDAQTGERYNNKTVFNYVKRDKVEIMRSDNLKLSSNVREMVRRRTSAPNKN